MGGYLGMEGIRIIFSTLLILMIHIFNDNMSTISAYLNVKFRKLRLML